MGFYQFFIIFICNIYLILFNAFTAKAADSTYTLTLEQSGGKECNPTESSISSNVPSTNQCVVGTPFEKFSLKCKASPSLSDDVTIAWYHGTKNGNDHGTLVKENERLDIDGEDNKSELTFKSLDVSDDGIYYCQVVKKNDMRPQEYLARQSIQIFLLPRVPNVRKDVTAIEGNPINLNCTVVSSIQVKVVWQVDTQRGGNRTFKATDGSILELQGNGTVMNNILVIKSANMTLDRGTYTCYGESSYGNTTYSMVFQVRTKGRLAAVWPFLGICAEVFILCVIILIYEKKRDKTELEESDTDQGPETKSSPDHGQDNVRYRK